MDVSGGILASLDAAVHAGMTDLHFSSSVDERNLMTYFVVQSVFVTLLRLCHFG